MIFQDAKNDCGATAVVNALAALGIHVKADNVRVDAGTTRLGATEHGLFQAIERAGAVFEGIDLPLKYAYPMLHRHLTRGGSGVILVEGGEHWVAAIGVLGDRIIFFDSENIKANRKVNGLHVVSRENLRRFWPPYDKKRYAILISKP